MFKYIYNGQAAQICALLSGKVPHISWIVNRIRKESSFLVKSYHGDVDPACNKTIP